MKKADVVVGEIYVVKVSGKLTNVRLLHEGPRGGYVGVNVSTGRMIRFRTAGRLRRLARTSR